MKSHQSHDVLLLCVTCHQESNCLDLRLRQELAEECRAPIGTEADVKVRCPNGNVGRTSWVFGFSIKVFEVLFSSGN